MSDSYSILIPGTRCVIVAGCPKNIGLVVQVINRIGASRGYKDGYEIQTISGRPFPQLWSAGLLIAGWSQTAITERRKLRPLVEPKADELKEAEQIDQPAELKKNQAEDLVVSTGAQHD